MGSPMIILREEQNPAGINANPPRRLYSSRAAAVDITVLLFPQARRFIPAGLVQQPRACSSNLETRADRGRTLRSLAGLGARRPGRGRAPLGGQSQRRRSIACRADTGAQV